MRTRSQVEDMKILDIKHIIGGDIAGTVFANTQFSGEGYVIAHQAYPEFVTEFEVADDLQDSFGTWSSFQHYKRSAKRDTCLLTAKKDQSDFLYDWTDQETGQHRHIGSFLRYYPAAAWSNVPFGPSDYPIAGLGAMYEIQANPTHLSVVPPPELDEWVGRGVQRCLSLVRPEMSLANSLYELKDVKTLRDTAARVSLSARDLRAFMRQLDKSRAANAKTAAKDGKTLQKISRATVSDLRRMSGDLYLQYKFNVAPFVSDTEGFFNSFRTLRKTVNDILSEANTRRRRHANFSIPGDSDTQTTESQLLTNVSGVTGTLERTWSNPGSRFHVEVEYTYSFTDFQKRHAAALTLLDKLGVNFNLPYVAWQAKSWSFAVDWVLGIGQYLKRLPLALMDPILLIHQCLWSHKLQRHIQCRVNVDTVGTFPVSSIVEESYIRSLFVPDSNWITSSGLDSNEWSLIAALVSTRR